MIQRFLSLFVDFRICYIFLVCVFGGWWWLHNYVPTTSDRSKDETSARRRRRHRKTETKPTQREREREREGGMLRKKDKELGKKKELDRMIDRQAEIQTGGKAKHN